jgi:hypothetical protein
VQRWNGRQQFADSNLGRGVADVVVSGLRDARQGAAGSQDNDFSRVHLPIF